MSEPRRVEGVTGDGAAPAAPSAREDLRTRLVREALRALAVRERSESELRERLSRRCDDPVLVDEVIDRLRSAGLQSDRRFAERYASEGLGRAWSGARIRAGLRVRGVDAETAAAAAAERPEAEQDRAREAARKRAATMRGQDAVTVARRLTGFLARRGYDEEIVRTVVAEVAGVVDP